MKFIPLVFILLLSATAQAKMVEETVQYKDGDTALEGYLVYDDEKSGQPGVLVFHEWWGLNDYIKKRTREMASLGYVAFAPDVYGTGVRPTDPEAVIQIHQGQAAPSLQGHLWAVRAKKPQKGRA